jgi:site-specific recombinase XerD
VVVLRERLARVDRGYVRPSPLTFGEFAERWFRDGPAKRGWKPRTIQQYRAVCRRLVAHFGSMRLDEVRPRHVAAYVSGHELRPATVGVDLSILHAIFKSAVREELVGANPGTNAERPKLPPFRPQILEPVEVARVAKGVQR